MENQTYTPTPQKFMIILIRGSKKKSILHTYLSLRKTNTKVHKLNICQSNNKFYSTQISHQQIQVTRLQKTKQIFNT